MSEIIQADQLQQVINKIETIEQERLESSDLLKDAFNEAKSMGFDVKIIKHVLKLRKKDKDALAEEDSLIDLYRGALGVYRFNGICCINYLSNLRWKSKEWYNPTPISLPNI